MARIKDLNKMLKNAINLVNKLEHILTNKGLLALDPKDRVSRMIHNEELNGFWDIYRKFVASDGLELNKTIPKYPSMIQKLLLNFYGFLKELGMLREDC